MIARKIEKAWVSIPVSCIDIRADDLLISGMSGKPIVKRNRFIYHADGNCTVNQSLEAKARASAGCNGGASQTSVWIGRDYPDAGMVSEANQGDRSRRSVVHPQHEGPSQFFRHQDSA